VYAGFEIHAYWKNRSVIVSRDTGEVRIFRLPAKNFLMR
jgi:hypothetical protein